MRDIQGRDALADDAVGAGRVEIKRSAAVRAERSSATLCVRWWTASRTAIPACLPGPKKQPSRDA